MANSTESTSRPSTANGLLLEQAQQALESLQYLEQAALYHAAASSLQKAITRAYSGDTKELCDWFEQNESIRFSQVHPASAIPPPSQLNRTSFERPGDSSPVKQVHDSKQEHDSTASQMTSGIEAICSTPQETEKAPPVLDAPEDLNPWAEMVLGANTRARRKLSGPEATGDCLSESISPADRNVLDGFVTSPESPAFPESSENDALGTISGEAVPEPGRTVHTPSFSLRGQTSNANASRLRQRLLSPPFWISTVVHAVFLFVLSAVLIVQAQKPERLAIVSATVEAENVLLETPTETSDSLEKVEETTSVSLPTLPDVSVPTPSLSHEPIGVQAAPPMQPGTSELMGGLSNSADGLQASKNLTAGAEFFGVKATGNTFVYVVDCSPSMARDGAFDAARQEMIRSLMSMKPKQRFSIFFFGKEIEALSLNEGSPEEYPVNASPENVHKAVSWLHRISIQKDGRPPNEALSKAIALQPDGIFLLFDGDTRADVAKHLRQANRSEDILSEGAPKAPIHVVHFFLEDYAPQMKKVAIENAGTYRFVPRPDRNKRAIR